MVQGMSQTRIWAHRGAGGWDKQYAPENTLPAFVLAAGMGADGVELDVQLTRDGQLVVCHDETIDRTSNGHGAIKSYTLAELRQFNFCSVHPEFGFVEIPTLAEVLVFMQQNDLELNIELKTGLAYYADIEQQTVAMVHDHGMDERVIYSSFNYYSLQRLRECSPAARIGILSAADYTLVPEDTERIWAEAVHPARAMVTADYVRRCHEHGIRVNVWTANRPEDIQQLMTMQVDIIITDCPDTGRRVVTEQSGFK